jgi:hypothetical protein
LSYTRIYLTDCSVILLKKNNMSKLFLKKARKIIFFLLFVI